jgi:hypothetical protein
MDVREGVRNGVIRANNRMTGVFVRVVIYPLRGSKLRIIIDPAKT